MSKKRHKHRKCLEVAYPNRIPRYKVILPEDANREIEIFTLEELGKYTLHENITIISLTPKNFEAIAKAEKQLENWMDSN